MNLLSRAGACAVLALSLAACSAAQQAAFIAALANLDATTAKGVAFVCAQRPRAQLIYTAALATGEVKPSKKLDTAFATVNGGCEAYAAGADVSGVATSMLLAYLTIKAQTPELAPLPSGLERTIVLKRGA